MAIQVLLTVCLGGGLFIWISMFVMNAAVWLLLYLSGEDPHSVKRIDFIQ